MIKHGMDVIRQAIQYLNAGQISVTTLFSLCLSSQSLYSGNGKTHLVSDCVVMLGGLHTENGSVAYIGDVLKGSGWTTALIEAGVAPLGKVDLFLRAAYLTRTRHAHQVALLTLAQSAEGGFHA